MRRAGWFLIGLMGLMACGPTIRYVYSKPGTTDEQRTRDEADCERLSWVREPTVGYGTGYAGIPSERLDRDRFNRCMEDRGYEVRQVTE